MDDQWITQRPLLYLENPGTSQWIESGCAKSINGFGGQSNELLRRQEAWRLPQVPREQREPGSSSFQFAVERVLSLLATKGL